MLLLYVSFRCFLHTSTQCVCHKMFFGFEVIELAHEKIPKTIQLNDIHGMESSRKVLEGFLKQAALLNDSLP